MDKPKLRTKQELRTKLTRGIEGGWNAPGRKELHKGTCAVEFIDNITKTDPTDYDIVALRARDACDEYGLSPTSQNLAETIAIGTLAAQKSFGRD